LNLILSLIIGCILCAAVCQSYVAVGVPPPADYWTSLSSRVTALTSEQTKETEDNYQKRDELEKALWANEQTAACQKMLSDDYVFYGAKTTPLYLSRFREKASMLASLDVDMAAPALAEDIYKTLLQRDLPQGPNSINVLADYSNLGRCCQLQAETTLDKTKRSKYFLTGIDYFKKAEAGFRSNKDKESLFNCLTNEYALFHAMQDKVRAREIFKELRQIKDSNPDNFFRELMLEQQ